MKCHNKYLFIAAALMALSSCSLEEVPEHFVMRDNYYGSVSECKSALNSCYKSIRSLWTVNTAYMTESCSDIFYSSSSATSDHNLTVTPSNALFGKNVWSYGYNGVMICNEVIECLKTADVADDVKAAMSAEARTIRALYYYMLTNTFGGVPFYTTMVATDDDLEIIRKLPRTDANEIRRWLYNDLKENAIPYFPESEKVRGSYVPEYRAGYPLALMLMAKFAMWYKDWEGALYALNLLEELYGELTEEKYPLMTNTLWRNRNTPESIFELQHAWSATGIQYHSTLSCGMTPTHADGAFDGVELPELEPTTIPTYTKIYVGAHLGWLVAASGTNPVETSSATYTNGLFRPLPLTFGSYDPDLGKCRVIIDKAALSTMKKDGKKIDRRVLTTLGLGNLETGDTFGNVQTKGRPWPGPKFWCPQQTLQYDANNYKIFRYADAVLMMAECYNNSSDPEKALHYLNMTRTRAGVDPITGITDEEDIMAQIIDERARELAGEMHRKFDLVRWGIWYDQVVKYNQSTILKTNIRRCHEYYPIPDTECALSGYVLTNDAYAELENTTGDD